MALVAECPGYGLVDCSCFIDTLLKSCIYDSMIDDGSKQGGHPGTITVTRDLGCEHWNKGLVGVREERTGHDHVEDVSGIRRVRAPQAQLRFVVSIAVSVDACRAAQHLTVGKVGRSRGLSRKTGIVS